jgi:hypothetical protein
VPALLLGVAVAALLAPAPTVTLATACGNLAAASGPWLASAEWGYLPRLLRHHARAGLQPDWQAAPGWLLSPGAAAAGGGKALAGVLAGWNPVAGWVSAELQAASPGALERAHRLVRCDSGSGLCGAAQRFAHTALLAAGLGEAGVRSGAAGVAAAGAVLREQGKALLGSVGGRLLWAKSTEGRAAALRGARQRAAAAQQLVASLVRCARCAASCGAPPCGCWGRHLAAFLPHASAVAGGEEAVGAPAEQADLVAAEPQELEEASLGYFDAEPELHQGVDTPEGVQAAPGEPPAAPELGLMSPPAA